MQNNPPQRKGYYRFTASVQVSVYNVFIACILLMSMSLHVVCICYRFIGSVDSVRFSFKYMHRLFVWVKLNGTIVC